MVGRHSSNAFALVTDITDVLGRQAGYGGSPDGAVIFGKRLADAIWSQQSDSDDPYTYAAFNAVMAHEYAHIAQFKYGVEFHPLSSKPTELMADFVAGWYVPSYLEISDATRPMEFIASLGDYDFNSPQHHGTPRERLNAYIKGARFYLKNRHSSFGDVLQKGYDLYI